MFHPAQRAIGDRQIAGGLRVHVPRTGEQAQSGQCAAVAQFGIAAAPDELQRLHQELDLPNAALAEFDVMPGYP